MLSLFSSLPQEKGTACAINHSQATRSIRRALPDMSRFDVIKTYGKDFKNRFFPSVRGAVLLIVIPAVVIVPVYFLTVVKEVTVDRRRDAGAAYEERFAEVSQDLPPHAPFNYVSDYNDHTDFFFARYALIPGRMIWGRKPAHDLLVVQYLTTPGIPQFKGYQLVKNYGNGVMLFRRIDD